MYKSSSRFIQKHFALARHIPDLITDHFSSKKDIRKPSKRTNPFDCPGRIGIAKPLQPIGKDGPTLYRCPHGCGYVAGFRKMRMHLDRGHLNEPEGGPPPQIWRNGRRVF